MNLSLTEEDAGMFLQLADAAVRAHGLQVARQAVQMMDLLDAAAAGSEPTATTPDEDSSDA